MCKYKADDVKVRLRAVGRKGIDYFKFNNMDLNDEIIGLSAAPDFQQAAEFISDVAASYVNGETDKIILVHNGYVSMIAQEVREDQVLPVDPSKLALNAVSTSELEVEPDDDDTLLGCIG